MCIIINKKIKDDLYMNIKNLSVKYDNKIIFDNLNNESINGSLDELENLFYMSSVPRLINLFESVILLRFQINHNLCWIHIRHN